MKRIDGCFFLLTPEMLPDLGHDQHLGYAFCDDGVVLGQSGAQRYQESTGKSVPLHGDGCYASVQKAPNGEFVVGADHAGMMPTFYYQHQKNWLVSNSLCLIVQEMRRRGIPVEPD